MRPPKEWLEEYDTWILSQEKEIQEYLKDVPREELIWKVDGNIYGRQSAAAQYRDRPEETLTNKMLVCIGVNSPEPFSFTTSTILICVDHKIF